MDVESTLRSQEKSLPVAMVVERACTKRQLGRASVDVESTVRSQEKSLPVAMIVEWACTMCFEAPSVE